MIELVDNLWKEKKLICISQTPPHFSSVARSRVAKGNAAGLYQPLAAAAAAFKGVYLPQMAETFLALVD